ncbi:YerC/YecD family TrpR-related protein [Persephonella sp.]
MHYSPTKKEKELFRAILALKDEKEAAKFFRDLLTISEIKEFANRFQIAKRVFKGEPYAKIAKDLGVSTTTVSRVAFWLKQGMGGYRLVLERISRNRQFR